MILKKMIIEGFKSFNAKQEFNFGDEKGIYFLSGVNKVDESLGSNGAGKSSIWDALCWVLYGKTVRGLKAGDLLTWFGDAKGFNVELEWELNGTDYKLCRAWNPNSTILTIGNNNPEDVDQKRIDEVFGIPYTPFLFSVVMGQARPMFFDLKESNKAVLFSEIFRLDRWIELSDKASADTKSLEKLIVDIDTAINKDKEGRNFLKRELKSFKELNLNWKNDNKKRINLVSNKTKRVQKELRKTDKQLTAYKKEKSLTETDIRSINEEIRSAWEIIYKTEERIKIVDVDIVKCESHIKIKNDEKDYFGKYAKGGKCNCTLCKQVISIGHARRQLGDIKEKIKLFGKDYHRKLLEKRKWKDSLLKVREDLKELEDELEEALSDLGSINSDISFLRGTITSLNKEKVSYGEEINQIENEANPFSDSMRDNNMDMYALINNLIKLKRVHDAVIEKKEHTLFWVKGFKDIRLYMISEFLTQLEIEVNSALFKLGLPDWKISFDIEKETKAKTIRKGFHVLIHSPFNAKPVPWEAWSGGESQRLRLAGNMGLSNLILSQYEVSPNIEIWDEPSSHLGKEGIEDLLDTLQDRAQVSNKALWIIEHNVLEFGNFVKTVNITKTEKGSIIN